MNKSPRFTLGMAVSNDFNGVWMTCQTAILNNPELMKEGEIIIIDNDPDSEEGKQTAEYAKKNRIINYVPMKARKGTAVRGLLFSRATSPIVVCVDAHVLLPGRSLMSVVEWLETNKEAPFIVSGPMLHDDGIEFETQWDPAWRNGMFGTWASDQRAKTQEDAFEIPMCGLGAFASRVEWWQGFSPLFSGFGGEEFYIHEKYRRAGGKAMCLPSFKWNHRFQRVNRGYSYPAWVQVRNYVVGWTELGLDVAALLAHFKEIFGDKVMAEGYCAAMGDLAATKARDDASRFLKESGLRTPKIIPISTK